MNNCGVTMSHLIGFAPSVLLSQSTSLYTREAFILESPQKQKAILFRTAKNMHNFNTCGMAGLGFYIKLTAKKLLTQFAHCILMLIIIVSDVEGGKDSLLHSRKWRAIELTHLAVNKSGRTLDLFFAFFGKNCVVKTADCNSNLVFHVFISI